MLLIPASDVKKIQHNKDSWDIYLTCKHVLSAEMIAADKQTVYCDQDVVLCKEKCPFAACTIELEQTDDKE